MKLIKLSLIVLFITAFKISFMFAQQDSVKSYPVSEHEKKDTLNKKTSLKDSTRIDNHPQDASDSSGFFIESKSGNSNLRIYASIRLFGAFDFNGLKGGTSFSVNKIPVGSKKNHV